MFRKNKTFSKMVKLKESKQTDFTEALSTYRFLDFFFFVPSGPTSQLQGDPELS